ncbi:hypothetical protein FISHEDRAFT_73789 [Fistulina hepatica ATCC 64428]|uniref:DUF6534 domain-containing protein n=1 Tax=Fistulina hepatica ATCC 64428 TaxID=1128425 RepID=A0A0D7AEB7_9AGAR|nr:hypothetical protein FISHEDRAFT_73789 [Fistulina hepatica ATCC 64428]
MSASTASVDDTIGVELIVALLGMSLWGVATSQMVKYYELYPKDKWSLKALVAIAWLFNTSFVGVNDYVVYHDTVNTLSDHGILLEYTMAAHMLDFLALFSALFAQALFLHRIWRFGRDSFKLNPVLFHGVLSLFLLTMAAEIVATIYQLANGVHITSAIVYEKDKGQEKGLLVVQASAAAVDMSLAVSLVYLLLRHQTGALRPTKHIIARLVTYSLTTGMLCLTLSVITIICRLVWQSKFYYELFSVVLASVYLNSLLAALNVRQSLRQGDAVTDTISLPIAPTNGGTYHTQSQGTPLQSMHFAPNEELGKPGGFLETTSVGQV